jgi:hypothetical protein
MGGVAELMKRASPHVTGMTAGAGISLASFRRFWAVAARWNSSRTPLGPRNRSSVKLQDALEVGEQHLDLFALAARGLVGLGLGDLALSR